MVFQDFTKLLCSDLEERIGEDIEISVVKSMKNNSIEYTGLVFRNESRNVAPTMYIDSYYSHYMNDEQTFNECVDCIYDTYLESMEELDTIKPPENMDFEHVKDNIIIRLVSLEKNHSTLVDVPYIRFMDMAIIFYYMVGMNDTSLQSLKVNNAMLDSWGITLNDLYEIAKTNTERLFPVKKYDFGEFVMDLTEGGPLEDECREMIVPGVKMFVVSNDLGINGASALVYDGMIGEMADEMESDLIILPSSIHELIVIPKNEDEDVPMDYFSEMVSHVNMVAVCPEEVLSDHAYFYDRRQRALKINC